VKPLRLFQWLITLCTRENQIVLDPYMGSGTTCIAAKLLKRKYIGIEMEPEYYKIAEARINYHEPEPQSKIDEYQEKK
jgi:site-specific DNA-methyltransferase (adenine-specific)